MCDIKQEIKTVTESRYGITLDKSKSEVKQEVFQENSIDNILEYAKTKGEYDLICSITNLDNQLHTKFANVILDEATKKTNEANAGYLIEGVESVFTQEEFNKLCRDFITENWIKFSSVA